MDGVKTRPTKLGDLHLALFIERNAAQFAVFFGEVDGNDNDVVLGKALGGEARGQEAHVSKGARNRGWPFSIADANDLRQADLLSRFQFGKQFGQLGAHWPSSRWQRRI